MSARAPGLRLLAAALPLLLAGCETLAPKVELAGPFTARPAPAPAPAATTGSLFQAASYRPLFEEHRARAVGDSLLVNIVERVQASQRSASSVEKKGALESGISALPFASARTLGRLDASGSSSNTFSGKGGTESANDFSGTISATVIEVLPNGHLIVSGEKQIGLNHNVEVMQFTGRVDPRGIQAGNMVSSAQIADVRLAYRGQGQQAEAQAMAWLARFFLTLLPL
ncbi:flagellar basal body L-ring protein FlgH [Ramlibacter sp. 2FC]|uniref:flagellar basal body L-ring protein FlgH n=1 Tax=Ramlibacter sp. 2FC TaxID=2502188 RepID=UPI001484EDB1|nr:flagellar basal body L-ring protein FlgH [Ramlibacter sp. 2FC]